MRQNPFAGAFSRRDDADVKDRKKTGLCGAPRCRCTPLLLALCIALTGLVLVGVGSCIVGFMGNDDAPKALGASLIAIGLLMMLAGCVCFVYDNYIRIQLPGQGGRYAYQPHESTQFDSPSTSYGAANPSTSDNRDTLKESQNVAPPAYDTVLNQKPDTRPQSKPGTRAKTTLVV